MPSTAPGRWLDATVTTARGEPVQGALVTVQMQAIRVPTDAKGRARLGPLSREHAFAWAEAPGFVQSAFEVPAADTDGGTLERTIVLELALSIAGRVEWADGSPGAGLDIEIQWRGQAKADAEGRFSLQGLPPGEHALRAGRDQGWRWGGVDGVQARVPAGTTDLVLTLPWQPPAAPAQEPNPRTVDVVVTDADGAPVPQANLTVRHVDGEVNVGAVRGHASIRAHDLLWIVASELRSESPGASAHPLRGPALWRGPLADGASEILIRLPPGRSVGGRVTDANGKAVAFAVVVAKGSSATPIDGFPPDSRAATDEEGRFQIEGLLDGECTLDVQPPPGCERLEEPVRVMAGETDVVLVLPRTADTEAVVTVLDDAGSPVPGAFVRFWRQGGGPIYGDTDSFGRHRLRGWPPGSAGELTICPPETDPYRTLAERIVLDWRPGDEVVRLERGLMTSGVVRDSRGDPVSHAVVEERVDDGTWKSRGRTDDSGAFRLPARPAGVQVLRARTGGSSWVCDHKPRTPAVADHVGPAREAAAGASDLVLTLDLGLPLRVQFKDWPRVSPTIDADLIAESLVAGASADDLRPTGVAAPVSAHGSATFVELDRGTTYTLWVGPLLDGRYALARGLRGSEAAQTVALEQGLRTTVRVVGSTGRLDVEVTARIGEFDAHAVRQADGSFVFPGLPTGSWPVLASTGFGDGAFGGEGSVTAGGDVEILLKPLSPFEPIQRDALGK
jgi:protocatechuate 3,4-dioxygenase beta subunit